MLRKANKLRNETANQNTSKLKKKKSRKKSKKSSFSSPKKEKFIKILGFFFILLSVYLLLSFTSYFFSWWIDFDKISKLALSDLSGKVEIQNWMGFVGAYLSDILIKKCFGIASYLFILIFFIIGVKLFLNIKLLSIGKTFRYSFIAIIWFSIALGFIFKNTDYLILGGVFGYQSNIWLEGIIGNIGTGILLLFIFISFFTIVYNFPFTLFKSKPKVAGDIGDINNKIKNNYEKYDKYNTVEFSVTEDDNLTNKDFKDEEKDLNIEDTVNKSKPEAETTKGEDIELTIENLTPSNNGDITSTAEHKTIDTEFDPKLDLPHYKFPTLELLDDYGDGIINVKQEELEQNKNRIVETLDHYSIKIDKIKATIGPAVTLYEIIPAPGVRISRIKNLEDDIALSLSAKAQSELKYRIKILKSFQLNQFYLQTDFRIQQWNCHSELAKPLQMKLTSPT
jgi:S-DNA-T family DNA segregation ATPase FtsK/SpoIIIE